MEWGGARESSLAVGIGKSGAEGRQKARLGFPHAAPRARRLDSPSPRMRPGDHSMSGFSVLDWSLRGPSPPRWKYLLCFF